MMRIVYVFSVVLFVSAIFTPASPVLAVYYLANVYKDFFKDKKKTPCLVRNYTAAYLRDNPQQKVHAIMLKEVSGGVEPDAVGKYAFEVEVAIKTAKLSGWSSTVGYCQSRGRNGTCHLYQNKGSFALMIQSRAGLTFKTKGLVLSGANETDEDVIGGDVSTEVLLLKRAGASTCSEISTF